MAYCLKDKKWFHYQDDGVVTLSDLEMFCFILTLDKERNPLDEVVLFLDFR